MCLPTPLLCWHCLAVRSCTCRPWLGWVSPCPGDSREDSVELLCGSHHTGHTVPLPRGTIPPVFFLPSTASCLWAMGRRGGPAQGLTGGTGMRWGLYWGSAGPMLVCYIGCELGGCTGSRAGSVLGSELGDWTWGSAGPTRPCPTGSSVGSSGRRGGSVFAGRGEEAAVGPAPPRLPRELIGAGMAACPGLPAFEPLPAADKPDWLEPGSAPALPGPRPAAAACTGACHACTPRRHSGQRPAAPSLLPFPPDRGGSVLRRRWGGGRGGGGSGCWMLTAIPLLGWLIGEGDGDAPRFGGA